VRIVEVFHGKPTTHTAGRVAYWAGQDTEASIVIDDTGVGGGVTDQLRAEGFTVTAFNAGSAAKRPAKFPNRRSEQWFEAAAQMSDIDLDDDEQLAADLTSPRYTFDMKMRQVVEKKEETKKRLGRSPDRADAVLLTLAAGGPGDDWLTALKAEKLFGSAGNIPKGYFADKGPAELMEEHECEDPDCPAIEDFIKSPGNVLRCPRCKLYCEE
jgi:hypothetical protein